MKKRLLKLFMVNGKWSRVIWSAYLFLSTIYYSPSTIFAADTFRIGPPAGSKYGVQVTGTADSAVETVINNGLRIIYTIGAIGVLIYFMWGILDWIFAGGDKEKIGGARKKMTSSLIGLILLALSAVIITVVGEIVNFNPFKLLTIPGLGDAPGATAPKTP